MPLKGFVRPRPEDAERYLREGWWRGITLGEMLDITADKYSDKEALVDDCGRLTYGQLRQKADNLAAGLINLGIEKGDSVLLQLPNWSEFVYSFYALHKIGATAVLLLVRHMQIEVSHFCSLTEAKAWIVPERHRNTDFMPLIEQVKQKNPSLEHIILARSSGKTPCLKLEEMADNDYHPGLREELQNRRPDGLDPAFIIGTGGTTGLPKAVPRVQNNAVCEAEYKNVAREQNADDICLISVPLEHNLGLAALDSMIFIGGKAILLDSTRPEDFYETVRQERVTCAPIVPALLQRLVNFERIADYDLSSLKKVYVGGAKTPPETIQAVYDRIGPVYVGAFGMSEGPSCTTHLGDSREIIFNTIGSPCCPYDEFITVDENGNRLPRNTEGELMAKGPGVFSGYLNNPAENRLAFTPDGFFRTGDKAVIDDDGNVRITGRIKDIILRGGENISPVEIETLLRLHPEVEDVAVIGVPDPDLGERACACIKPKGTVKPDLREIVAFLKSSGASVLQLPERVEYIDEMPLTNIGKPDKKALRERFK